MVWIHAIQALVEPLVESRPNANVTWTSFHAEAADESNGATLKWPFVTIGQRRVSWCV